MSVIQTLESALQSEAAAVERGFESIAARLKAIGAHVAEAIVHPGTPKPLRDALPDLMDVLEDLRQELAELRKPCPCEGQAPADSTQQATGEGA